ncbi:alpha/beta hydrolase [Alteribacillus sp. YIM 98480]|uniref:alpha/beta hydrolase n=1 Tax=Alteribacillus sp. YIM 98480 TaxID=2606599 RepID=UPI00131DD675|nr:alpha/beta hydrolase [Alteribacillus sp. YIM 98480]
MQHIPKKKLSYYDFQATTLYACRKDQRFSYCAYIPKNYKGNDTKIYNLVVLIHGTERASQGYRDSFIDFAEETDSIILAPLFPAGIMEEGELNSYKFIKYHDIRYDHILLSMVDEINEKYRVYANKFLLHGFSGGGHFVHRFLYLHPDRLSGVSIGAPGMITYLDQTRPWHVGTKNFEEVFGKRLDLQKIKKVPVHMVVGSEDTETWEINIKDGPFWIDGIDRYGATRIDRLKGLKENYAEEGIEVSFDLVPGAAHEGFKLIDAVKTFFKERIVIPQ